MKPKIYHFKDHDISPKNIDPHAFYIVEKLKQRGFSAYLVGGSVRDLLLKQIPKDFDISTSATPREIKGLFKRSILIGKRFLLAHVRFGKKIIEVATFRAGDISSDELIEQNNIWGSEEEDVLRRDFTINGLFYDPEKELIIDYVGGFKDAKKGILKTIGDPMRRFTQDPVRMIRLLKFKARFDFKIDKKALEALKNCKKDILKCSQARIFEELLRMLQSGASEKFFKLLFTTGILEYLLPNISNYMERKDDISPLLRQADSFILKHKEDRIERAILLSSLLFPILDEIIEKKYSKNFHLGIVSSEARSLVKDSFLHFFHLPKKIKSQMITILTDQFRISLSKQKKGHLKIPKDPSFPLSMKFFKLRSMYQKNLIKEYTLWNEQIVRSHKKL